MPNNQSSVTDAYSSPLSLIIIVVIAAGGFVAIILIIILVCVIKRSCLSSKTDKEQTLESSSGTVISAMQMSDITKDSDDKQTDARRTKGGNGSSKSLKDCKIDVKESRNTMNGVDKNDDVKKETARKMANVEGLAYADVAISKPSNKDSASKNKIIRTDEATVYADVKTSNQTGKSNDTNKTGKEYNVEGLMYADLEIARPRSKQGTEEDEILGGDEMTVYAKVKM